MDAIIAVIALGVLLAAFWNVQNPGKPARLFTWRNFWIANAILLTTFEVGSLIEIGRTMSQQYFGWSLAVPLVVAAWPALLVVLGGLGLATHLLWKRIKR